eukprot:5707998-Prymnesium_polylepis.1
MGVWRRGLHVVSEHIDDDDAAIELSVPPMHAATPSNFPFIATATATSAPLVDARAAHPRS